MKQSSISYIKIDELNNNQRIDIALSNLSQYSRSMIQKLIYDDKVKINNIIINKSNKKVSLNEIYSIEEPATNINYILPQKGNLDILFEDESIIVLNKPAHLVTHPGVGNHSGTLVNFLAHHCTLSDINGTERLGVVHRLDKGVSGCIIFAKTNSAHIDLNSQFQNRTVQKYYKAICYGKLTDNNGIMQDLIGRCEHNRQKMASKNSGKDALMNYKVENCHYIDKHFGFISQILCMPKTGRMHQIRVQLSSRRVPIIGDKTYGKKQHKELIAILGERIALHAHKLEFTHPVTKESILITAPEPDAFKELMKF